MRREERAFWSDLFLDQECPGLTMPQPDSIKEIEESILEIRSMLMYAMDREEKDEIASFRRMLQEAKEEKIRLKKELAAAT